MPYIKTSDRPQYNDIIKEMVSFLTQGPESQMVKGEYYGFFLSRLCLKFMNSVDYSKQFFNSHTFSEPIRKKLSEAADKTALKLTGTNPLEAAGNLNYIISAILWGILGDCAGVDKAGYAFRCYLKSITAQVRDSLNKAKYSNDLESKEILMLSRRYTVAYGVVGDVIDEVHLRKNTPYEDQKIAENGDVWVDGNLLG